MTVSVTKAWPFKASGSDRDRRRDVLILPASHGHPRAPWHSSSPVEAGWIASASFPSLFAGWRSLIAAFGRMTKTINASTLSLSSSKAALVLHRSPGRRKENQESLSQPADSGLICAWTGVLHPVSGTFAEREFNRISSQERIYCVVFLLAPFFLPSFSCT